MSTSSENAGGDLLVQPINITDLLSSGSRFEIDTSFDQNDLSGEYFDDIGAGSEDEDDLDDIDPALITSPWTQSFDSLRTKMIQINENIYKRVVKAGIIEQGLVPDRARVYIQYASYQEFGTSAFDSTFMRGRNHEFYTGYSEILPGVEEAVRTMYSGEESQFVISYKLLFGEMGCPPRIQPKTDYLYVIKVFRFTEVGDATAIDSIPEEDRNKFYVVLPKVQAVHKKGLDFFKLGNYQGAIRAFHNGTTALAFCKLKNKEEEKEQNDFLIKLYTNLAVCYMKQNLPAKVCSMCNELRGISKINTNAKALYTEGKALRILGEYKRAKNLLVLAQKIQPNNPEISKELKILAETYDRYQKNEKEICEKAIGIINNKTKDDGNSDNVEIPFKNEMQNLLESFQKDLKIKTMPLPEGLSNQEIECIKELTGSLNLRLNKNPLTQNMEITKIST